MYSIDFIRSHELWAVLYTYVCGELTGEISPSVIPRDAIADEITLHVGIVTREFAFRLVENQGSLSSRGLSFETSR